jgi:hypothetical protein
VQALGELVTQRGNVCDAVVGRRAFIKERVKSGPPNPHSLRPDTHRRKLAPVDPLSGLPGYAAPARGRVLRLVAWRSEFA